MQPSSVGIINLGLLEIGADIIEDINDLSPNARKIAAVYPYLLKEVLQAKDWRFAKLRASLTQTTYTPDYAYQWAYALPSNFLRLVKPHPKTDRYGRTRGWPDNWLPYRSEDAPFWPPGHPYIFETNPADGTLCLLTNYPEYLTPSSSGAIDLSSYNIPSPCINYIQWIEDPTKFTPAFTNALAKRIAAAVAVSITEDKAKWQAKALEYKEALTSAEAVNESLDWQEDEAGGDEWVMAGRRGYGY